MAIVRNPVDQSFEDKIILEFNNGDFKALNEIVTSWGFKDIESAIRFGIAALVKASEKKEFGITEKGKPTTISPADSLLKEKEPTPIS